MLILKNYNSSRIQSSSYDEAEQKLVLHFVRGGSYEYYDVTMAEYTQMNDAPSIGKAFDEIIKTNHPGHKI